LFTPNDFASLSASQGVLTQFPTAASANRLTDRLSPLAKLLSESSLSSKSRDHLTANESTSPQL
jgi:hypothetical protein